MTELTSKQLRQAAGIKDKIEALQADLNRLLGGGDVGTGSPVAKAPRKKWKMSAAARAKIAAAQRARWAKQKAGKK